jgi:hypothetical protein
MITQRSQPGSLTGADPIIEPDRVGRTWRRGSGGECSASGAGRAVFDKPRIAGSVRPSKHGANMRTKRTRKDDLVFIKHQVRTGAPPGT